MWQWDKSVSTIKSIQEPWGKARGYVRTYSIFWKIRSYGNVFYFSARKQE